MVPREQLHPHPQEPLPPPPTSVGTPCTSIPSVPHSATTVAVQPRAVPVAPRRRSSGSSGSSSSADADGDPWFELPPAPSTPVMLHSAAPAAQLPPQLVDSSMVPQRSISSNDGSSSSSGSPAAAEVNGFLSLRRYNSNGSLRPSSMSRSNGSRTSAATFDSRRLSLGDMRSPTTPGGDAASSSSSSAVPAMPGFGMPENPLELRRPQSFSGSARSAPVEGSGAPPGSPAAVAHAEQCLLEAERSRRIEENGQRLLAAFHHVSEDEFHASQARPLMNYDRQLDAILAVASPPPTPSGGDSPSASEGASLERKASRRDRCSRKIKNKTTSVAPFLISFFFSRYVPTSPIGGLS